MAGVRLLHQIRCTIAALVFLNEVIALSNFLPGVNAPRSQLEAPHNT